MNKVGFQVMLSEGTIELSSYKQLENLLKEEADHFDIQSPLAIHDAEKEKIGRVETGYHKMKVSAIYDIKSFKFDD